MTAVVLGGLGLLALLLLGRAFTRVDPHTLAQGIRAGAIFVCIIGGIALLATGKVGFIFLPLGALLALFAGRHRGPQMRGGGGYSGGAPPNARTGAMSRAEAFSVLG